MGESLRAPLRHFSAGLVLGGSMLLPSPHAELTKNAFEIDHILEVAAYTEAGTSSYDGGSAPEADNLTRIVGLGAFMTVIYGLITVIDKRLDRKHSEPTEDNDGHSDGEQAN